MGVARLKSCKQEDITLNSVSVRQTSELEVIVSCSGIYSCKQTRQSFLSSPFPKPILGGKFGFEHLHREILARIAPPGENGISTKAEALSQWDFHSQVHKTECIEEQIALQCKQRLFKPHRLL